VVGKALVQSLKIDIVDVFCDETRDFRGRVSDNIQQCNNVWPSCKILENFDFPLNLFLFDWFQDFDDAFFLCDDVDALKDLMSSFNETILGAAIEVTFSPLSIFLAQPSEQSHNDPANPTGLAGCLNKN